MTGNSKWKDKNIPISGLDYNCRQTGTRNLYMAMPMCLAQPQMHSPWSDAAAPLAVNWLEHRASGGGVAPSN